MWASEPFFCAHCCWLVIFNGKQNFLHDIQNFVIWKLIVSIVSQFCAKWNHADVEDFLGLLVSPNIIQFFKPGKIGDFTVYWGQNCEEENGFPKFLAGRAKELSDLIENFTGLHFHLFFEVVNWDGLGLKRGLFVNPSSIFHVVVALFNCISS